ncbi:MAG: hypothetical protein ACLTDS_11565 [Bianqueaceae bacterium]
MPAGDEAKDGSRRAEEVGNGSRLKKGDVCRRAKAGREEPRTPVCPPGIKRKVEAGVQRKEEMEAG